jgi:hypothetical protein
MMAMWKLAKRLLVCALVCPVLLRAAPADAQSTEPDTGSEDGIAQAIEATSSMHSTVRAGHVLPDEEITKWVKWRKSLLDAFGLDVSFSYDTVAMGAFGGDGDKGGFSGDATLNLRWHIKPESGDAPLTLAARVRDRTAYADLAPSDLRRETNALWGYVDGFNNAGFEVPELYLDQRLFDRQLTARLGQMSMDDFFDDHWLRSAKRSFMNQSFSSNPAAGFPGYGMGAMPCAGKVCETGI